MQIKKENFKFPTSMLDLILVMFLENWLLKIHIKPNLFSQL